MKRAFTLAEVLLTLAVIGIVAAITLPSLLVDTTEKAFDAQKRALHARLAQAIGMMSTLSGYGQYVEEVKNDDGSTKTEGKDDAAETFLYEGLSKVYKMNNICDSDNLDKCGIPSSITKMNGDTMDFPKKMSELTPFFAHDTKAAAFETVNGESIAVFYNPNCISNITGQFQTFYAMCANFVYDLNGAKGPNKAGRDIGFITALGAKNPEVAAPIPFETDSPGGWKNQPDAMELCSKSDDSRLPNRYETAAIYINKDLIGNLNDFYWSSSINSKTTAYRQSFLEDGASVHLSRTEQRGYVRCVRK